MTGIAMFPIINPMLSIDWLKTNATGKGVQIAIIDSGVDALHPALQGRVVRTCVVGKNIEGVISCEEVPVTESTDNFGHGTAVAGCVTGVAPEVEIINVKVLNDYNACTGDILIAGLEWALQQGIRLINMSLATSKQQWIQGLFQLVEQAYIQNTIIVASRRNIGDLGCPAMFSSVISVDRESYTDRFQLGYRANNMIEYDARGTEIEVLVPGGGYAIQTGTSFATPHVTGMVALLLEKFPTITGSEAKTILKALAQAQK